MGLTPTTTTSILQPQTGIMTWKVVTSGTLASNQFPLDSFLLDWILIASCAGEIYSLKRMLILIDQFCSTLSWAERKSMKKE